MAKEPPWKYLAGIDTSNPASLKRCMTVTLSRLPLKEPTGANQQILVAMRASIAELEAIRAMFQEMNGNYLLERLTRRWAKNYDKPVSDILEATEDLKRDATFYVRRPDLYKEEYKVAERAFFEGGWVYMGQVVHWFEIPEDELRLSRKAVAKRAKHDARMDGIEYVVSKSRSKLPYILQGL